MGQIQSLKNNVCCPGVMKTAPGKTYCCIGGTNDNCGQVTCFTDLSSCQHTVDVDSPDYKDQIQKLTGKKPPSASGGSNSGSGSSSSSAVEVKAALTAVIGVAVAQTVWYAL
ncbi:hypothetical protein CI102_9713 [Trichoderma harzianum]|nr:hypothetical protein CI102_9713 [Trichoderma harzianum]